MARADAAKTGVAKTTLARVQAVRAFNRFWTARIGVLDATHLGSPFSLAEARVLYELAQRDESTEVGELRRRLDLDAGYLSRLLAELRERKLVVTEASATDARRQTARLTAKGRAAQATLDGRAVEQVRTLLGTLDDESQERVLGALTAVKRLLERREDAPPPVLRAPGAGDFGWIVARHGELYAREYGWDERFEGLVATIAGDYLAAREPRSAAWIAEVGGERAGCVLCAKKDATVAQLRLLLVEPRFRGTGLGARLVGECVRFARAQGYRRVVLWTNDVLVDARRLYERAGFELVESKAHESFGKRLTAQTWQLSLREG
jgi:DNA-binding MarR family transcriptional regulator/N-acetylglutamate synthase-like GNAT family acetyltransferase